jgi:hypothetical protein
VPVLIVGQSRDSAAIATRHREHAVDIPDCALVPVKGPVGRGVAEGGDILRDALDRATGPGIDSRAGLIKQMEKAFKVRVQNPARNAVRGKGARKLGNAGRRLTGFGNGGVDEEHRNSGVFLVTFLACPKKGDPKNAPSEYS